MSPNFPYCFYVNNSNKIATFSLNFIKNSIFFPYGAFVFPLDGANTPVLTVMTESSAWLVTYVETLCHLAREILSVYNQTELQNSLLKLVLATKCWLPCTHTCVSLDRCSRFYLHTPCLQNQI